MKCKVCKTEIKGRPDKKYCGIKCKNFYHTKLRSVTKMKAKEIDKILHRNRSILLELMGKNTIQKKIPRLSLEKRNFKFTYLTHFHTNKQGKVYHYVYDFAWMQFSNDEILIVRS